MTSRVVFTPEAEAQLVALYRTVADAASPAVANRYTGAIVSYCEGLVTAPGGIMGRHADTEAGARPSP